MFSVLGHWLFEYRSLQSPFPVYNHASYLFSPISFRVLFDFIKTLLHVSDSVAYKGTSSSPCLSWIDLDESKFSIWFYFALNFLLSLLSFYIIFVFHHLTIDLEFHEEPVLANILENVPISDNAIM